MLPGLCTHCRNPHHTCPSVTSSSGHRGGPDWRQDTSRCANVKEHWCQFIFTSSYPMTSSFKQMGKIFRAVYQKNIFMPFLFPIKMQSCLIKKKKDCIKKKQLKAVISLSIHNGQAGRLMTLTEKILILHKTSILRKISVTVDIVTKIRQPRSIPEMVTIKHANRRSKGKSQAELDTPRISDHSFEHPIKFVIARYRQTAGILQIRRGKKNLWRGKRQGQSFHKAQTGRTVPRNAI